MKQLAHVEYINIHASVIESEAMQDASHLERSAWLLLLKFCAGQENGGRIAGAKSWPELKWLRMVGISREEALAQSRLWSWSGEDLEVQFYPSRQEAEQQAKRWGAHKGGRIRARQLRAQSKAQAEPARAPMAVPQAEPARVPEAQRNGMECNEREWKGREERTPGDAEIPSEVEVRDWASGVAGVDPDYAADRARRLTETHGWVRNGRLVLWRNSIKRWWEEDREKWLARQKKTAATRSAARLPGDADFWWEDDAAGLRAACMGAAQAGDSAMVKRIQEVIEIRNL